MKQKQKIKQKENKNIKKHKKKRIKLLDVVHGRLDFVMFQVKTVFFFICFF